MNSMYPVLISVVPLSAGMLSPLFSYFNKQAGRILVQTALVISFLCSLGMLFQVMGGDVVHYWMGNWEPPYGIEYVIDGINAFFVVFISFVGMVSCFYSKPFTDDEHWLRIGGYYTLYALLAAGLYGQIITGDVFNLYVFLEISSLAGYGLIALGGGRSYLSAFRYLLIGTIGASCYLLGVGYLYAITGSLNMADMAVLLQPLMSTPSVIIALSLFLVGFGVKMALFPFHFWQPDAYTDAHPGAAPIISGIMGKVPIYAFMRYMLYVFGVGFASVDAILMIAGILAAIGIIYGSVMAIAQKDMRRMLAYSSVAQIGYIVLGISIANPYAIIGAALHLINHAFAKTTLFMAVGNIRYRFGEVNMWKFGQLHKTMPITAGMIVIAALSMIGIPPTGGFFSKWYLLLGCWEGGHIGYAAVLLVSSLLNAIYFFRLIEDIYIKPASDLVEVHPVKAGFGYEVPWRMVFATTLMGLGILALGFCNEPLVTHILNFALPEVMLP